MRLCFFYSQIKQEGVEIMKLNKLFATGLCRIFKQHHRCASIVHHHGAGSVAPAESYMDAGIAALESFGHQVKICQGAFHERNIGHSLESRDLVGVPSRDHYFVTLFQKGLDHVMSDKTSATCN